MTNENEMQPHISTLDTERLAMNSINYIEYLALIGAQGDPEIKQRIIKEGHNLRAFIVSEKTD